MVKKGQSLRMYQMDGPLLPSWLFQTAFLGKGPLSQPQKSHQGGRSRFIIKKGLSIKMPLMGIRHARGEKRNNFQGPEDIAYRSK